MKFVRVNCMAKLHYMHITFIFLTTKCLFVVIHFRARFEQFFLECSFLHVYIIVITNKIQQEKNSHISAKTKYAKITQVPT